MQFIDMQVIYGTVGRLFTICHFSQVNEAENITTSTYKLNIIEPFDNVFKSIPCSAFCTQPSL